MFYLSDNTATADIMDRANFGGFLTWLSPVAPFTNMV